MNQQGVRACIAPFAICAVALAACDSPSPSSTLAPSVQIDADDIGGVVTSARGPEAGAWVIAETNDFATRYAKIVVTDDQGRYLVPDLPTATYKVWVRGYGLADSAGVHSTPGKLVDLTVGAAPDARPPPRFIRPRIGTR